MALNAYCIAYIALRKQTNEYNRLSHYIAFVPFASMNKFTSDILIFSHWIEIKRRERVPQVSVRQCNNNNTTNNNMIAILVEQKW